MRCAVLSTLLAFLCLQFSLRAQTIFDIGDLLFCAINASSSGSTDEICFFSLKDIVPGTNFSITDNGFEKDTAGKWGDTEGAVRWTYTGMDTIERGTVICWLKPLGLSTNGEIWINGICDTANWLQSDLGLGSLCNLSSTGDQLLFMQDENWIDPVGLDNAMLASGKLISGITTSISWGSGSGANFSNLPSSLSCAHQDLSGLFARVKYTGDLSAGNSLDWKRRMFTVEHWTDYDSTAEYNSSGLDFLSGYQFSISDSAGGSINYFTGEADSNWFDCRNWSGLEIPDSTTSIHKVTAGTLRIPLDSLAYCKDIYLSTGILDNSGSLEVYGDFIVSDSALHSGIGRVTITGVRDTQMVSIDSLHDLRIRKTKGSVYLEQDIQVIDTLRLEGGIVCTNGSLLEIGNDSTNPGALIHSNGFINGKIRRWISRDSSRILFPIGDSLYRPVILCYTVMPTNIGSITAELMDSSMGSNGLPLMSDASDSAFEIGLTEDQFFWRLDASPGDLTDGSYTIELYPNELIGWDEVSPPSIVKRSSYGPWTANGVHHDLQGVGDERFVSRSGLSGFSDFGIGYPVIFLHEEKPIWQLQLSEKSVMILLKEPIGKEISLHHSYDGILYAFQDTFHSTEPDTIHHLPEKTGPQYYKLEWDDQFTESRVVYWNPRKILNEESIKPTVEGILIVNTTGQNANYTLKQLNLDGRVLLKNKLVLDPGAHRLIPWTDFTDRTFLLTLESPENGVRTSKLIHRP